MEEQKTALSNQIEIADKKAQYDAEAKRILSNKIILSWILQKGHADEKLDCVMPDML